jgi:hypothetical protein
MGLLFWPVLGALIGYVASQKRGLSPVTGVLGGLLLGPFAFLMFFVSGAVGDERKKKCPFCKEWIQPDAVVCKHCGQRLDADTRPGAAPAREPQRQEGASPAAPWRREPDERASAHRFVPVVGESHYQDALQKLSDLFAGIGREDRNFTVRLVPEPKNAFDPNAVMVTTEDGTTLGYLSKDIARTYQRVLMRQPSVVTCPAQLRGGSPEGTENIGVVLDFVIVHRLKSPPGPTTRP